MMFVKVNAHTVKCIIGENEITEMGYKIEDICKNQDLASEFMKNIIGKANQAGFPISEDVQAVQATFLPTRQLVLCFMDGGSDEALDQTIKNLLHAFGLVETIGKDRLEEIENMTGEEKRKAFEECFAEAVPTEEVPEQQVEVPVMKQEETIQQHSAEKYILAFQSLDLTESFCKTSANVPGKLYKDNGEYLLLADLTNVDEKDKKSFLLMASEYASRLKKNNMESAYLEEHGDILIGKNVVEVLKNL